MLEREIKLLLDENAIREVVVGGSPLAGYTLLINGKTVKSSRRETRQFAKLDTVAAFLLKLGLTKFSVVIELNGTLTLPAQTSPKERTAGGPGPSE
jgi:sulfur carrier protein ThiS